MVCKTILMAATQVKRGLSPVPIFQIGTSSHSPVTHNHAFCVLEQYWRQARLSTRSSKISNNVQAVFYNAVDFELQFCQRFSKELRLVRGGGHESLRRKLAQAYWTPKMYTVHGTNQWFWDVSNSIALDDAAPASLHSGLKNGLNWDEYLHIYNMGLHEFILKERVDKTLVVNYFRKSVQKHHHQSSDQTDQDMQHCLGLSSRL